jgi:predicted GIY-YIG superfamily endonuclease
MPSWVYILRCADNSYYTGCTTNIDQRLDQHYRDKIGYTSKRKPLEFLWSEEFANLDDAAAFEKQVKGWSRAKKEALMRGDWPAIQQMARAKKKPPPASA